MPGLFRHSFALHLSTLPGAARRVFSRNRLADEGGDDGNQRRRAYLTASNFERSREFYRKLLPFLGLKPVIDTETTYYCVGGRTAVGISAPSPEHAGAAFEQKRVGLHHLCFRARERADIDELHTFLATSGTTIIRAPREDQWAPGYYSLLFEDPDGMRLELNHVPGKGLLV